jgi:uncharacterized protein (DUF58 family)
MRSTPQRVRTWAERQLPALTRHRRPESLPILLHRRRIYILPSSFGIGFSILLLVMLAGALNYTNNAALLLTCLLGAASAASMLVTFRSLDGLRLDHIRAGHAVAGQPVELSLAFASDRTRQAMRLDFGSEFVSFALEAGKATDIRRALPTAQRGWHSLPPVRVWSRWPLGLFHAWSWLRPDFKFLVWPQPETAGPPPGGSGGAPEGYRSGGDEPATLRDYRAGDPRRHIAWKASARHPQLLVKDFEHPQNRQPWELDWRHLPEIGHEARIARLARWVEEAHAQQRSYSLSLPSGNIATDSGPSHYIHCMDALAQLP